MTTTHQNHLLKELNDLSYKKVEIECNGKRLNLFQKQICCKIENCFQWLEKQSLFPKIYWNAKNNSFLEISLGKLCEFDNLVDIKTLSPCDNAPKIFAAKLFEKTASDKVNPWKKFPQESYFLPEIMVKIGLKGNAVITFQTFDTSQSANLSFENQPTAASFFEQPLSRLDIPTKSDYAKILSKVFDLISSNKLHKVVISRLVTLKFKNKPPPYKLLEKLQNSSVNTTVFGWFPSAGASFIGSSPENLYKRKGRKIYTHAIAGTTAKGSSDNEEKELTDQLTQSEKDLEEFNFVTEFLDDRLRCLCESHTKSDLKVISTSTVQHLCKEFDGFLKKNSSDLDIIEKLHPTPAMGGLPQKEAKDSINALEPYNRGYYSSVLGWFSENFADALVGIRSASISDNTLSLYSGGGIVKDSNIESEWNELELKISQFLKIL